MKKSVLLLVMLATICGAYAQGKQANLYGAYVFDDKFESYTSSIDYANGKVLGGLQWGVGLEFKVKEDYGIELLYYRQDTQAPVHYYNTSILGQTDRNIDLSINYILLGANRYMQTGKVEPYGGLLLGAAIFNNNNAVGTENSSATKFAVGFRLGANIWVSDKVGIKLQAQFLSAVQGFGGGMYFGTGGAGAGVSTYSSITQLGLGGGLVFKLGE